VRRGCRLASNLPPKTVRIPVGPAIIAIANILENDAAEAERIGDDLWRDAPKETLEVIRGMPSPIPALYQIAA